MGWHARFRRANVEANRLHIRRRELSALRAQLEAAERRLDLLEAEGAGGSARAARLEKFVLWADDEAAAQCGRLGLPSYTWPMSREDYRYILDKMDQEIYDLEE